MSIFISELTKEFKHVLTFHSLQTNIQLHTSDKGKNKIIFEITSDGRKGRVVILCFGEGSLCVITNQKMHVLISCTSNQLLSYQCESHSSLMVSVLASGLHGPGSSPGQ